MNSLQMALYKSGCKPSACNDLRVSEILEAKRIRDRNINLYNSQNHIDNVERAYKNKVKSINDKYKLLSESK